MEEKMDCELTDDQKLALLRKEEGNKLYAAKDYKEAIKLYSEAIALDPDCAAYYGNRAAAHMMNKAFKAAIEDARCATKLDHRFVKGYMRAAKCYMSVGQSASARDTLHQALEIEPKNKQIQQELLTLGRMVDFETRGANAYQQSNFQEAEYNMRKLIEIAPASLNYKGLQAECLALMGKYGDAQILANDIIREDQFNCEGLYVRGLCLYYQDQTERAYRLFQQLLRTSPDFKKAKDAYKKARLLETTKEEGNQAFRNQDYAKALERYTTALAVDPLNTNTNAKLYNNRGTVNYKLNNKTECIEDCTKAINLDATYIKPYLRRAKCYMDTEQYEDAVRDYEKVTKMDRSNENRQLLKEAKLELKKSQRKDYYKIIGVPKTATDDEIKKAYRKEALKHHPDRHSNETDEKKKEEERLFKEVGEAYSVLSDPQKKARYDSGQDLEEGGMDFGDFDPNIIFQSFFGGGGGGCPGGTRYFRTSGQQGGFPSNFSFSFG